LTFVGDGAPTKTSVVLLGTPLGDQLAAVPQLESVPPIQVEVWFAAMDDAGIARTTAARASQTTVEIRIIASPDSARGKAAAAAEGVAEGFSHPSRNNELWIRYSYPILG
jgi:hypothetical protein